MAELAPENWTASANETLEISIQKSDGSDVKFNPIFTYPIFGDLETVFGYRGLKMKLSFDSASFLPLLEISYDAKLPQSGLVDPQAKLMEFLPSETIINDRSKWLNTVDNQKFTIPGEVVDEYHKGDSTYKIFKTDLTNTDLLSLHLRLQILVLLFIEAGSYIDHEDPSWDIYLLYEFQDSKQNLVGFCTVYNYFLYQGHESHDSDLNFSYRKKISQFIILPSYQGQGHGQKFYQSMFNYWWKDPNIKEICVEDPNESFDDLRDRCDLMNLSKNSDFITQLTQLKLPYTQEWFNSQKLTLKIEKRQLQRLIEMLLIKLYQLKQISNKKSLRIQIKKRIYWKNKESLLELDQASQIDKLQTAFEGLEQDYERIMENLDLNLSLKRSLIE